LARWCSVGVLLLLGACATAVSGSVPGADDGGDDDSASDAAVDAGSADAPLESTDAAPGLPPDAHTSTSSLVALSPSPVIVARGHVATVTVSIHQPARAGGEIVALSATSGTAATLPATVTIPEGLTSTTFQVNAVAFGGPFDLTATLDGGHATVPLRVVPGIAMITPSTSDVTVGDTAHYTITLEAASAVALDLALDSAASGIASVPTKVTVAAGQSTVGFDVAGVGLGGPVVLTASVGGTSATARARSLGVYLSEVLYDATSNDTNLEWVELYNAASVPVELTGVLLQSAGGAAGNGYNTSLTLAGTLAPGECAVVGGPSNAGVTFFQAVDLNPDLGNASSSKADGIRLATAAGAVLDAVIYGSANTDMITDEEGMPSAPDVGGVALANQTIERTAPGLSGPWQVQATPSPGDCAPISQ
jgi:hypothetical protein